MNEENKKELFNKEKLETLLSELISLQKEQINLSKETYNFVKEIHNYVFDKEIEDKKLFKEFCFNVLANWFVDVVLHEEDKQKFSDKLDSFIKTINTSF